MRYFIGITKDGVQIFAHQCNHLKDHDIDKQHLIIALQKITLHDKKEKLIKKVKFPTIIGYSKQLRILPHEHVFFKKRHNREGKYPHVLRTAEPTKYLTVVLVKDSKEHMWLLETAFYGPPSCKGDTIAFAGLSQNTLDF